MNEKEMLDRVVEVLSLAHIPYTQIYAVWLPPLAGIHFAAEIAGEHRLGRLSRDGRALTPYRLDWEDLAHSMQ